MEEKIMKQKIAQLRERLIEEARKVISMNDPSHDWYHALRVLANAEQIAQIEGGDLEVIIPAALFHDAVNYSKDDPRSKFAADESAMVAAKILQSVDCFDKNKIPLVCKAICEHSYGKGITPELLESKIVQDADRLEVTGAIAIMRTFCSSGQMRRIFYNPTDPFCENRTPESLKYAVDLFYGRLLIVNDLMNTSTARELVKVRTHFLKVFLEQLRSEIML